MSKLRDMQTMAAIKIALISDVRVGGIELGVRCVNGIVFLRGFVQDSDKSLLAEKIAKTYGAIDVKNDIRVLGEGESQRAAPRTCSPRLSASPEDEAIRIKIVQEFEEDPEIDGESVDVEVWGGIVRLSGRQNDPNGRRRAVEIASGGPKVRDVIDDIGVRRAA